MQDSSKRSVFRGRGRVRYVSSQDNELINMVFFICWYIPIREVLSSSMILLDFSLWNQLVFSPHQCFGSVRENLMESNALTLFWLLACVFLCLIRR